MLQFAGKRQSQLLMETISAKQLSEIIDAHFNLDELREICLELHIDVEHLRHQRKLDLIEDLLIYCARRYELKSQLLDILKNHRDFLDLPNDYSFPAEVVSVPRQYPPATTHFVGREEELDQLFDVLHLGRSVLLFASGGMGKTAITWELLRRLEHDRELFSRFPDGVLFYSFYGQGMAENALRHFVLSFDEKPEPTPQDAARRVLANKNALIVLDGAEEADDLQTVLSVCGNCGIFITSRKREPADVRIEIQPLPDERAVDLLCAWNPELEKENETIQQICELVGNLPLAVRLVGRYMDETGETPEEYLDWLKETPIEALSQGEHREDSVSILLERSLDQLNTLANDVFSIIGILAFQSFGVEPIVAALELPVRTVRSGLSELVKYGLLLRKDNDYVVSHTIIYTYAHHEIQRPVKGLINLAKHFCSLAVSESKKGAEGFKVLDLNLAHYLLVQKQCVDFELWQLVVRMTWAIGRHDGYLSLQNLVNEWKDLLKNGLKATQTLHDVENEVIFLNRLGHVNRHLRQIDLAIEYYSNALQIVQENNLGEEFMNVGLSSLGHCYDISGDLDKAEEFYTKALEISVKYGSRENESGNLISLGRLYFLNGDVDKAEELFLRALDISISVEERRYENSSIYWLGRIAHKGGEVREAIRCYEKALIIAQEIGDRKGITRSSWMLGIAFENIEPNRAIEYFSLCLDCLGETEILFAEKVSNRFEALQKNMDAKN